MFLRGNFIKNLVCKFSGSAVKWRSHEFRPNCNDHEEMSGLVLGVYCVEGRDANTDNTKTTSEYNRENNNRLCDLLRKSGPIPKANETRVFYDFDPKFNIVVVVGLGVECAGYSEKEQMDESKEAVRTAAGTGVKKMQELHVKVVHIESFGDAESAAEGSALGLWIYQEYKNFEDQMLELYGSCDYTNWQIGLHKAAGQNLARQLSESAANLLTPVIFAQIAVDILAKSNVNVEVKLKNWAKAMGMEGFLSAAKGSCEPPVFLEASYYGCSHDVKPIVLIGKGVTFDSGGLCLKEPKEMKYGRSNMSGAATVIAVCRAAAELQLPINVRALVPLFENMPGSCAYKPGDIIRSRNGKSIIVNDTDFDGRISLTDALSYASVFRPKLIIDIGMLCREVGEMIGAGATVVFTNNDILYEQMKNASIHTGDRVWRLPLWEYYHYMVRYFKAMGMTESGRAAAMLLGVDHETADTGDIYRAYGAAGSCAAFLHEFVPGVDWMHLDTYGVTRTDGKTFSYLREGMTGRPTRTLIELLASMACKSD